VTTLTSSIHIYAVKYSWEDKWCLRASDSATMAEASDQHSQWVLLGIRDLQAELPDEKTLLAAQVSSLRKTQAKVMAEAEAAHTKLEEAVQSLLSLPAPSHDQA
jgi:hypothetical protein